MITDINNLVTIVRQKNGKIKIIHDINNEGNIYKLLRDFGFRKSKLDNVKIYYRKHNNKLSIANPTTIKQTFLDFLERADYTNLPNDVSHDDILEWYYSKKPIKENGLYDHYLKNILSESEIHTLRLLTNNDYKHKFDIDGLIAKFSELNFTKTVDSISSYSSNNPPLYYKYIGNGKYIVFNHWNYDKKNKDGFDCWLAIYANEEQVGKKKPIDLQKLRLGFQLERDLPLIEQYLE